METSSADEIMRKRIVVIIAGAVALMVIGVIIWIVSLVPKHNGEVRTINQADVVESGVLTERNLVAIENTVNRKIEAFYSDKVSGGATISVRTDSVKKDGKNATALADVEELHITYAITLDTETGVATSNCAAIEDTKYLDGFCASGETSTISVALKNVIPHIDYLESSGGEKGKNEWKLRVSTSEEKENPDGSKRPYLVIEAEKCGMDDEYIKSVKEWLSKAKPKISPEIFQYKVICEEENG